MYEPKISPRRMRPLLAGLTGLLALAILVTFAPARNAAADFLGLFRVRKFAVIPVDPGQSSRLEELIKLTEGGAFGQPTIVRPEGPPAPVTDAPEASAAAGFPVRAPSMLPEGITRTAFEVRDGPAIHFELDRATLQPLLELTQIDPATLPDLEKFTLDLDVPKLAIQQFDADGHVFTLTQLRSPELEIPAGVDLAALGESGLVLLGMPLEDARRLANSIDWATTLVIPLPTDVGAYRELTVDGVSGLLLEESAAGAVSPHRTLLWQRDDITYVITGSGMDAKSLLLLADSLD